MLPCRRLRAPKFRTWTEVQYIDRIFNTVSAADTEAELSMDMSDVRVTVGYRV